MHLEGVVAFLDCISSLLLGSCVCFSTPLLVTDAVATITEMRLNANNLPSLWLNFYFLSTCLHHLLLRPAKAVAVADPRLLDRQNSDSDSWPSFTGLSPSTLVSSVAPIFLCRCGHLCTTSYQLRFHTLVKPVAQSCCTTSSDWFQGS